MKPLKTWLCVYADECICGCTTLEVVATHPLGQASLSNVPQLMGTKNKMLIHEFKLLLLSWRVWSSETTLCFERGTLDFTDPTGQGILPCWLNLSSKLCSVVRDILTLIFWSRAERLFVKRLTAESAACTVQPEKRSEWVPFWGLFKFLFICHFTIF